jgi:hypothetical protein
MSARVEILHQLKEHPPLTLSPIHSFANTLSLYLSRTRKNPRTRERKE